MHLMSFLNPYNNFFSQHPPIRSTTTATASTLKEHELVTFIKKINFEKTPFSILKPLREMLKRANIEHPICHQMDEKISRTGFKALGYVPQLKTRFPTLVPSENCYVQPYAISIAETIKALEAYAGKIDAIEICFPSDELMAFITDKFPNLKSLVIQEKPKWYRWTEFCPWTTWEGFTKQGLESIAKLQHLKRFDLMGSTSLFNMSTSAIENLLNQPQFIINIEELNLEPIIFSTKMYSIIANYQRLAKFHSSGTFVEEGLNELLKSPTLKKSFTDFSLLRYNEINDVTLQLLQNFSLLEHLTLEKWDANGIWNVSSGVFLEFLGSQKKLKSLRLSGPTIDDAAANNLHPMINLEDLYLEDCSKVSNEKGWPLILSNKEQLKSLELHTISTINNSIFSLLGQLPLKFLSLSLQDNAYAYYNCLKYLCEEKAMQENLQTLRLENFVYVHYEEYKFLSNLNKLTSLRLDKCRWFNNEALETLFPLANSLDTLELGDASIDDRSVELFAHLKMIKNLFLSNCYPLTENGLEALVKNEFLRKNIICLGTDNIYFNDRQAFLFQTFEKIKILILSSAMKMSDEGEKKMYEWALNKKVKVYFPGGGTQFEHFEKGVEDVKRSIRVEVAQGTANE